MSNSLQPHGILQARILEWVAFPFSGDHPNPGIEPRSPTLQVGLYQLSHKGKPIKDKSNIKYIASSLYRWDRFGLSIHQNTFSFFKKQHIDFPGSPVVKTPCFHCRGHGFHSRQGTNMLHCVAKKKKNHPKKAKTTYHQVILF